MIDLELIEKAFNAHEGAPTWEDDPVGRDAAIRWHMRGFHDALAVFREHTAPTDDERAKLVTTILDAMDPGGYLWLAEKMADAILAEFRLVPRGEAESDGPLNVERENAAAEYTRYNIGGMQPVMTIGERVHDAFVSGAEWAASFRRRAPAEPAVRDTAICDHGCTAITGVCLVDHKPAERGAPAEPAVTRAKQAIHAALASRWMTVANALREDGDEAYEVMIESLAVAALGGAE